MAVARLNGTDTDGIAALLATGAIGVIATDTVYGLAARAHDETAVKRLYALKDRDTNPGTIIAANTQQLESLGLKHAYVKAVEQYWPNPLSVVIPCGESIAYLHLGKHSLAVRIPHDEQLRQLLEKTGPLLTSSANHPGEPTAETIADAEAYFDDRVDFYADSGELHDRPPSTVIRIVDDAIEVLRMGAVHINEQGRIVP